MLSVNFRTIYNTLTLKSVLTVHLSKWLTSLSSSTDKENESMEFDVFNRKNKSKTETEWKVKNI